MRLQLHNVPYYLSRRAYLPESYMFCRRFFSLFLMVLLGAILSQNIDQTDLHQIFRINLAFVFRSLKGRFHCNQFID